MSHALLVTKLYLFIMK